MSIPKEPRQQMINMMYLFLTAMLALNVSAEILRAFKIVNESLEKTALTIDSKNEIIWSQFKKKLNDDPDKTRPYYNKAEQVRKYSKELVSFIKEIKDKMIDEGGDKNGRADIGDYKENKGEYFLRGQDNLNISHRLMLVDKKGKKGKELKDRINETRKKFLKIIAGTVANGGTFLSDEHEKGFMENFPLGEAKDISAEGGVVKKWQSSNFGEVPLAAAVTLLSKYETDARNAEADILSHLLDAISISDFKFDELMPVVVPNSKFVMQGGEYKADIFISAFSSTQNPEIIIGGVDTLGNIISPEDTIMLKVNNGIGRYSIAATGVGSQIYAGVIRLKNPSGEGYRLFPFRQEYSVMVGQAVVSPTKMNVLYIGVPNPLAVSAAGFTADKVKPTITGGGSIRSDKKKGEYLASVRKVGTSIVNVSVQMEDGSWKKVGAQEFRVKRIPPPQATLGGKYPSGKIKVSKFKAQRGMVALLKDFVFDARFAVISFEMLYSARGQDLKKVKNTGPSLNERIRGITKNAKKGDLVFFQDIKVKGPDGVTQKIPSLSFELM